MDSSTKQEIIQKLRAYPLKKKLIAVGDYDTQQYQEAWELVKEVEDTLPHLTDREKELIDLEFWSNKDLTIHGYMVELNISGPNTYYRHRDKALRKFGLRMGLVTV